MKYQIIHTCDPADISFIHDTLYEYNLKLTGSARQAVSANIYESSQALLLLGEDNLRYGGMVWHLDKEKNLVAADYFIISDALRGQGCGIKIFTEFERLARESGMSGITLGTNTFQAPDFYRKMGYDVVREKHVPQPLVPENIHYLFVKKFD